MRFFSALLSQPALYPYYFLSSKASVIRGKKIYPASCFSSLALLFDHPFIPLFLAFGFLATGAEGGLGVRLHLSVLRKSSELYNGNMFLNKCFGDMSRVATQR